MLVMPKTLTMKPRRLQDAQTPAAPALLPAASSSGFVPRRLRFAGLCCNTEKTIRYCIGEK